MADIGYKGAANDKEARLAWIFNPTTLEPNKQNRSPLEQKLQEGDFVKYGHLRDYSSDAGKRIRLYMDHLLKRDQEPFERMIAAGHFTRLQLLNYLEWVAYHTFPNPGSQMMQETRADNWGGGTIFGNMWERFKVLMQLHGMDMFKSTTFADISAKVALNVFNAVTQKLIPLVTDEVNAVTGGIIDKAIAKAGGVVDGAKVKIGGFLDKIKLPDVSNVLRDLDAKLPALKNRTIPYLDAGIFVEPGGFLATRAGQIVKTAQVLKGETPEKILGLDRKAAAALYQQFLNHIKGGFEKATDLTPAQYDALRRRGLEGMREAGISPEGEVTPGSSLGIMALFIAALLFFLSRRK